MRGLLIFAILLAFPALELFLVGRIAREAGWELTLAWLFAAAVSGVLLIRGERRHLLPRIIGVLQQSNSLAGALFAGISPLLAGLLLIFPGPVSDVLAILLLLAPAPAMPPLEAAPPRDDGIIEGEWRREETFTYTGAIGEEKTHGQEIPAPGPENRPAPGPENRPDPGGRPADRGGGPR